MNPKLKALIDEIKPDTIDDSFLTGEVTNHMVEQIMAIRQLQQLFPSLTYSRRGQSERKKLDIKVFLNGSHIFTMSCYGKQFLGRIYTDYISDTDLEKAVVLDGKLGADPEPGTMLLKYRKRENWDQKYYKWYDSIATMKEDMVHIIDIAISKGVNEHSFFSKLFEKIKNDLKDSECSVKVASSNRLFLFFEITKNPCVIINIDSKSTGSNILECTQGVYDSISNEISKYIPASSKNGYPYAVNVYEEEILSIISCLKNTEITTIDTNQISGGDSMITQSFDKNLILYGPPGTGKTYSTAIYAVAICDSKNLDELTDYDAVMRRYNELKSEGRIAFTTFHQSYGYEEFIEGIKPLTDEATDEIHYHVESGIFKSFCETAKKKIVEETQLDIPDDAAIWKVTIRKEVIDDCFENNRIRINHDFGKWSSSYLVNEMKEGDIILTTCISCTNTNGIAIVTDGDAYELNDAESDKTARNVKWIATNIDEDIVALNAGKQFNRVITVHKLVRMRVADVIEIAKKHNKSLSSVKIYDNTKPYVFVIDEINRGNISKIFGELITLIEDTKREGMPEAASAILPYSGEPFSVPENVYLLGTMNTADRSIALMDTALRRRFSFEELMPDADVLRKIGADKVDDLDVAAMLEAINERITFLYDREHTIGHAFFTKLKDVPTLETLKTIFKKSVIPLLQEYFYEDYQKIQLVLGDNGKTDDSLKFITDEKVVVRNIFKGRAEDVIDIDRKYSINNAAFDNLESYKQIK